MLAVTFTEGSLSMEKEDDIARGMGRYPPLGLLYLAGHMRKHSDHEVILLDADGESLSLSDIEERLCSVKPDLFGITAFTPSLVAVCDILKLVKKVLPDCITVVGGPHVSIYPDETLAFDWVDYVLVGDGEHSFLELVNILDADHPIEQSEDMLRSVDGIVFQAECGDVVSNGYARVQDLDSLEYPDRSLLDHEKYFCVLGKRALMTTLATSRGCPFRCTFCNSPDKKYRIRSPKSIVDEMEHVYQMGITEIFFFDDLFNINRNHVIAVCDEIVNRGLHQKIGWSFRGRVNSLAHEDVVEKLSEAGCERVQLGIEKATDESLKAIRKDCTVAEIESAVSNLHKHGIESVGNFILFTPGESKEDAEQIIKFAMRLKLDHAEFHVYAPYPKAEIYEKGLQSGLFARDYWAEFARNPYGGLNIEWDDKVSHERKYEIANRAYRRFYFRPRIIWRELLLLRSWAEFKRKFDAAYTLIKVKFARK